MDTDKLDRFSIGNAYVSSSHLLGWHRGAVWCWRCAKYTVGKRAVGLRQGCLGSATTPTERTILNRLRDGKTTVAKMKWPLSEGTVAPRGLLHVDVTTATGMGAFAGLVNRRGSVIAGGSKQRLRLEVAAG